MAIMAAIVHDEPRFEIRADWDSDSGATCPELAQTWCSLEIRVEGRAATFVEDMRVGSVRKSIHTSAYPLAEWIATRWFGLSAHVRPSARSASRWRWSRVTEEPWLRNHNVRGAGSGMPWPDLTIVPEGAVTRIVWNPADGLAGQPVRFLGSGDWHVDSLAVREGLATFVEQVIMRLRDSGIRNSPLEKEWLALAELDRDQRDFALAAARLGLDPFNVDDIVSSQLECLDDHLQGTLLEEFLDSVDPSRLLDAENWIGQARLEMSMGSSAVPRPATLPEMFGKPWDRGYVLAQQVRSALDTPETSRLDLMPFVGTARVAGDSGGLDGLVEIRQDHIGLAIPQDVHENTQRFGQARALGLSFLTSGRKELILSSARDDITRVSRAFAAELLAPSQGIKTLLRSISTTGYNAVEEIAALYGASPVLVAHQIENKSLLY